MDQPIRIAVVGANGRMGLTTVKAIDSDASFELVAAVGRSNIGVDVRELAGCRGPSLLLEDDLGECLKRTNPDVVIEFSHSSTAIDHARIACENRVSFVFGMTGISAGDLNAIDGFCRKEGVSGMYVPNFAIGAVLMMYFAELAARWLPDAEIIEFHHERKEDAPSGTSVLTAEKIGAARRLAKTPLPHPSIKAAGARGGMVVDVPVHSVRLPGLLAHQEVLFGGPGETLTIRHDSLDRSCFMSGVKLCAKTVKSLRGLTIGLDKILF